MIFFLALELIGYSQVIAITIWCYFLTREICGDYYYVLTLMVQKSRFLDFVTIISQRYLINNML